MKKVALISLALASSVFALDEYMPLAPQKLEIDFGVSKETPKVGNATTGVPLQFKYGVMNGLDLELAATYKSQEAGTGLAQPELAAKYAIGDMGLAVFANIVLPFATGDRADGYAGTGIAPGLVYGKNYGQFQAVGLASYQINMKDGDLESDNILRVYLKPGYMLSDKIAGYVGIDYVSQGDGNSTKLVPGLTWTFSDAWAMEANIPYAVAASDDYWKTWGIWASLYYTLGL